MRRIRSFSSAKYKSTRHLSYHIEYARPCNLKCTYLIALGPIGLLTTVRNLRAISETSITGAARATGEAKAVESEGDIARVEDVGQALALHNRLAIKGQEGDGLARAIIVVPDGDAGAQEGVLGVEICLEGVVVDAPVAVNGGLVASCWSSSHSGLGLGLAGGRGTNGAGLP